MLEHHLYQDERKTYTCNWCTKSRDFLFIVEGYIHSSPTTNEGNFCINYVLGSVEKGVKANRKYIAIIPLYCAIKIGRILLCQSEYDTRLANNWEPIKKYDSADISFWFKSGYLNT